VVAASIASTTISTIITNSDGLSKNLANSHREICLVAMRIPDQNAIRNKPVFAAV
jgi:hypothetical protein